MSALLQAQLEFGEDVSILLPKILELGYRFKFGHALRSTEDQERLVREGRSWTLNSRHLDSLAIDLLLFRGDEYLTDEEEYAAAGLFWESLRPGLNRWGVNRQRPRKDANHFERKRP